MPADVPHAGRAGARGVSCGDLRDRGLLHSPRILPRYLEDPDSTGRLLAAAHAPDLTHLWEGTP
ncbi:MAG TPA: hypothetical protein PK141_27930 [Polyangiaceae bacterium]|nr:hypothetical protein [Polyangiaceae bacterium]